MGNISLKRFHINGKILLVFLNHKNRSNSHHKLKKFQNILIIFCLILIILLSRTFQADFKGCKMQTSIILSFLKNLTIYLFLLYLNPDFNLTFYINYKRKVQKNGKLKGHSQQRIASNLLQHHSRYVKKSCQQIPISSWRYGLRRSSHECWGHRCLGVSSVRRPYCHVPFNIWKRRITSGRIKLFELDWKS